MTKKSNKKRSVRDRRHWPSEQPGTCSKCGRSFTKERLRRVHERHQGNKVCREVQDAVVHVLANPEEYDHLFRRAMEEACPSGQARRSDDSGVLDLYCSAVIRQADSCEFKRREEE